MQFTLEFTPGRSLFSPKYFSTSPVTLHSSLPLSPPSLCPLYQVLDECHHTTKEHAYAAVMAHYLPEANKPKVGHFPLRPK